MSPTQTAKPTAPWIGIASPGSVPNAALPTQVTMARNTIAPNMPVRCAASFSIAIRRLPKGAAATMSRLPRCASEASVPDSAVIDHSPAISPKNGPYFHESEPPNVSTWTGLLYRPLRTGGMLSMTFCRSSLDAGVE